MVNVQEYPVVIGVPSEALIVFSSLAAYVVELARAPFGVSVAVADEASYETVAGTVVASGLFRVKLELVTVEASRARENVALTDVAVPTFVAPSAGFVVVTEGGVPGELAEG